ncbi:MAG TPA: hypothetical protein VMD99_07355 [Terriglobales bacterium]|nr:hypothetical protein [Terriglobales bacterium]
MATGAQSSAAGKSAVESVPALLAGTAVELAVITGIDAPDGGGFCGIAAACVICRKRVPPVNALLPLGAVITSCTELLPPWEAKIVAAWTRLIPSAVAAPIEPVIGTMAEAGFVCPGLKTGPTAGAVMGKVIEKLAPAALADCSTGFAVWSSKFT